MITLGSAAIAAMWLVAAFAVGSYVFGGMPPAVQVGTLVAFFLGPVAAAVVVHRGFEDRVGVAFKIASFCASLAVVIVPIGIGVGVSALAARL